MAESREETLRRIERDWHYGNLSAFRDSLNEAYDAALSQSAQRIADLENEVKYADAELGGNSGVHLCDRIHHLKARIKELETEHEDWLGIIQGLEEVAAGKVKPLSEIRAALKERKP